jgi:putative NADH-flavin reductase
VKLALFGATGGVGRPVLSQAIAAGHTVTAVVRNPSKLSANVEVVRQDLAASDVEVLHNAGGGGSIGPRGQLHVVTGVVLGARKKP